MDKILEKELQKEKYIINLKVKNHYTSCEYKDFCNTTLMDDFDGTSTEVFKKQAKKAACKLYKCKYANVEPSSFKEALLIILKTFINSDDTIMIIKDYHQKNFINYLSSSYNVVEYTYNQRTETIDYDDINSKALQYKPKLIISGGSLYSHIINFKELRFIADNTGAYILADLFFSTELVTSNLYPSPLSYADVSLTMDGIILTNNDDIASKISDNILKYYDGELSNYNLILKCINLNNALSKKYIKKQIQAIKNAHVLCDTLTKMGVRIVSGGTDNYFILLDVLSSFRITGEEAQKILDNIGILTNKYFIPYDTESPTTTSGIIIDIRISSMKGLKIHDFIKIGMIIYESLNNPNNGDIQDELKNEVLELVKKY